MTPQEQALGELKAIGLGALTADDLADFAAADDETAKKILAGWKHIASVRDETLFQRIGDIVGKVADWTPIAIKIVGIAALL